MEVVPLTLLTLDASDFIKLTRGECDVCGKRISLPYKWAFYFLMAVGVWNFVGAGVFGFLINLPIVSYFEVGTILTPNHGHAAMMGVFGLLGVAFMVFAMRRVLEDGQWARVEKYVAVSFWGLNIGLALMVILNLFPGGGSSALGRPHQRVLARQGPGVSQPEDDEDARMASDAGRPHLYSVRGRPAVCCRLQDLLAVEQKSRIASDVPFWRLPVLVKERRISRSLK